MPCHGSQLRALSTACLRSRACPQQLLACAQQQPSRPYSPRLGAKGHRLGAPHGVHNPLRPSLRAMATSDASPLICGETFFLDSFALRQWEPGYAGTQVSYDKEQFVARVHEYFKEGRPLVDGYAPFCKHVFVPNFVGAAVGALPISDANRHLVRSGYTSRRPEELAVLTRWFAKEDVSAPEARFLDLILYSREQMVKEHAAMPRSEAPAGELPPAPWAIISIKAQDEEGETPMQPITMLRNALGREEGGSGVPIDRVKYAASVAYWEAHATIQ